MRTRPPPVHAPPPLVLARADRAPAGVARGAGQEPGGAGGRAPRLATTSPSSITAPTSPYWFGIEANSIAQFNPPFHAPYSGTNSFGPNGDGGAAISGLLTVFTGHRPTRTTEIILDGEMAVGGGLSSALGIAGFTNLDVVRNPTLPHDPYVARFEIHQLIPLSDVWEVNEDRGPISSFA